MNIVCFPHAGGQASTFHFLKNEEVFNIISYEYNAHGSKINEKVYETFDDAIKIIADDIIQMNLDDMILFGHSMGAYIAYETAYILESRYHKRINAVLVSGQVAPSLHMKNNIENVSNSDFIKYLIDMGGISDEVKVNEELLEVLLPIIRSDYMLLDTYHPNKLHVIESPLYIFVGDRDTEVVETNLQEWKLFSKNFKEIVVFKGKHFYLHNNQKQFKDSLIKIIKKEPKRMEAKKYSWAPTVKWKIMEANKLKIANFIFQGEYTLLFPRFYDMAKQGVSLRELEVEFEQFNKQKLNKFIKNLIDTEILIIGVQQIDAMFYSQNNLFSANYSYDEEIRINAVKLNEFKLNKLLREKQSGMDKKVQLSTNEEIYSEWKCRKTTRLFDVTKQVTFVDFSNLLSCLMQRREEQDIKYYYPSAGGLYPIDIYIYVKNTRVENVDKGIYYYKPQNNELVLISEADVEKNIHYYQNQKIFECSAFSILFVYNAHVSMPKYDGMAYYYGIIEAGILSELLSLASEKNGLGSCIIGEIDYRNISPSLKLSDNEIYLICMEFGYKK